MPVTLGWYGQKIPLCSAINVLSAGMIISFLAKYGKWSMFAYRNDTKIKGTS